MINKPPPFKGLNIRIHTIVPIKGRGFINHGSGLRSDRIRKMVATQIYGLFGDHPKRKKTKTYSRGNSKPLQERSFPMFFASKR